MRDFYNDIEFHMLLFAICSASQITEFHQMALCIRHAPIAHYKMLEITPALSNFILRLSYFEEV